MKNFAAQFCLSVLFNAWVGLQFTRIFPINTRLYVPSALRSTIPNNPDIPRFALEEHYNETMCKNTAPLFQDFATYLESLPIREVSGNNIPAFKLYDLPYWVEKDEIREMAKDLEKVLDDRSVVTYVVAPSKAGKTASILPAF